MHAVGFRPMLYDLQSDPSELRRPRRRLRPARDVCAKLREALLEWALTDHNRITMSDARIERGGPAAQLKDGILIGYWDEAEVEEARRRIGPT